MLPPLLGTGPRKACIPEALKREYCVWDAGIGGSGGCEPAGVGHRSIGRLVDRSTDRRPLLPSFNQSRTHTTFALLRTCCPSVGVRRTERRASVVRGAFIVPWVGWWIYVGVCVCVCVGCVVGSVGGKVRGRDGDDSDAAAARERDVRIAVWAGVAIARADRWLCALHTILAAWAEHDGFGQGRSWRRPKKRVRRKVLSGSPAVSFDPGRTQIDSNGF